jgi:hypothetical protein
MRDRRAQKSPCQKARNQRTEKENPVPIKPDEQGKPTIALDDGLHGNTRILLDLWLQ